MSKYLLWWMLMCAAPVVLAAEGPWPQELSADVGSDAGPMPESPPAWSTSTSASALALSNGCSGTWLSDQGLILTTARCARDCLTSAEQQDPDRAVWQAHAAQGERSCGGLSLRNARRGSDAAMPGSAVDRREAGQGPSAPPPVHLVFYPAEAWLAVPQGPGPQDRGEPQPDFDFALLRAQAMAGLRPAPVTRRPPAAPLQAGQPLLIVGYAVDADVDAGAAPPAPRSWQASWQDLAARQALLDAYEAQHPAAAGEVSQLREALAAPWWPAAGGFAALGGHTGAAPELAHAWAVSSAEVQDFEADRSRQRRDAVAMQARKLGSAYGWIEQGAGFWSSRFAAARQLVRWAEEQQKPDAERLPEFRAAQVGETLAALERAPYVDPLLERACLSYSLRRMQEDLGPADPFIRLVFGAATAEQLAARLTAQGSLGDPEVRVAYLRGGAELIAASSDPMIQLARAIERPARALRDQWDNEVLREAAADQAARPRPARLAAALPPSLRVETATLRSWVAARGSGVAGPSATVMSTPQMPGKAAQTTVAAAHRVAAKPARWLLAEADAAAGSDKLEGGAAFDPSGALVGVVVAPDLRGSVRELPDQPRRLAILEWLGVQQLLRAQLQDPELRAELQGLLLPSTTAEPSIAGAQVLAPVLRGNVR
jgi:hypothetical protein